MASRCLALALALGLSGCRRAPPPVASEPAWGPPGPPGLALELTPRAGALDVEVRLVGPRADAVRELRVTRAWAGTHGADALEGVAFGDASGPILVTRADEGADVVLRLARAPSGGDLRLRYRARGATEGPRFALRVDAEHAAGVGHAFLLLPRLDEPIATRVRFHLGALPPGSTAATSFGQGLEEDTTATSEELAHAAYLAGRIDVAEQSEAGASGPVPRVAILGRTRLAPLGVLHFSSRALGLARELFGERDAAAARPLSLLLVAEPGLAREHEGAWLGASLGVWFGDARTLDARMKLVVAHELLHRWIGGAVRLRGDDDVPAAWFDEGFTAHYARRLLFDAGLVDQAAFLDDLRRVTSGEPDDERERDARRGALYAATLDASIRRVSRGARSLDDVMRALVAASTAAPAEGLRIAALRGLVAKELGATAGEELDRWMVHGDGEIPLPDDAFGPCFARVKSRERSFELGFERASVLATPAVLRHLVPGSAAEKAGLSEGVLVLKAKLPPDDDAKSEIELVVADRQGGKRVRYRPESSRDVVRWQARDCR